MSSTHTRVGLSSVGIVSCPRNLRWQRHFGGSEPPEGLRQQHRGRGLKKFLSPLLHPLKVVLATLRNFKTSQKEKARVMVDLFVGRVLVKNNAELEELDTEREVVLRLQNRIVLLLFGSGACDHCRDFAPVMADFYKRLTDEFYVERSAQLVLLYISLDSSEDLQAKFLKELPKRCLFLPHKDPYRKYECIASRDDWELEVMFKVEKLPTVVVLRPDCSVLSWNAVTEICTIGPDCYRNWQEGAELIDRNFMMNEEYDESKMRSITDPIRRLKYKVDGKKRKKEEKDAEEDIHENDGGAGTWR